MGLWSSGALRCLLVSTILGTDGRRWRKRDWVAGWSPEDVGRQLKIMVTMQEC